MLEPLPLHYSPSIVYLDSAVPDFDARKVRLTFHAIDSDHDLLGYRIYVSKETRGWNYETFYGSPEAMDRFWSNPDGWRPDMYDAYHQLPPADIALWNTPEESLDIFIPDGETYYVSIMAFDVYGEQVGLKLYPASNELKLNLEK